MDSMVPNLRFQEVTLLGKLTKPLIITTLKITIKDKLEDKLRNLNNVLIQEYIQIYTI